MWWCFFDTLHSSSNILLRKVQAGLTTLHACCNLPTNAFRCHFRHDFLPTNVVIRLCNSSSLWVGSLVNSCMVSSSIPRKVMTEQAPSSLSTATGIPKCSETDNSNVILAMHSADYGRPMIRKSSR